MKKTDVQWSAPMSSNKCQSETWRHVVCDVTVHCWIVMQILTLQPNISNLLDRSLCWRTSCPSALSLLPMSLRTCQPQSCARTWYLEILFGIVFTKCMVCFGEEISDFRLHRGRFNPKI